MSEQNKEYNIKVRVVWILNFPNKKLRIKSTFFKIPSAHY